MGNIPQLQGAPQTEPLRAPRFSPSATPAAFGGAQAMQMEQLGGAVGHAGETISRIGAKILQDKIDADLRSAVAEYRSETREMLYGEQGILRREGKDAEGASLEAKERLERLREAYAKRFATPESQEAWARTSLSEADSAVDVVARHQSIQIRRYEDESLKAHAESAILRAVDERDNPNTRRKSRLEIAADMGKLYAAWGPDVQGAETQRAFQRLDADIVDSFLADGMKADALEYIKEHEREIDPAYLRRIKPALQAEVREDALLADALKIAAMPGSDSDRLAMVDAAFKDADERDYVRTRVEEMNTQKRLQADRDLRGRESLALTEAFNQWSAGNVAYQFPKGFDWETQAAALRLRKAILGGEGVQTDWGRYIELSRLSQTDPEAFKNVNLNHEVGRLETTELRELAKLQVERTTQAEWNRDVDTAIFSAYDKIPREYIDSRAKTATAKNEDKRRFRNAVRMALVDSKPGDKEALQAAIDAELRKGFEERPWYKGDREALKYQIPPEQFYIPEEEESAATTLPPPSALWMGNSTPPSWLTNAPTRPPGVSNDAVLSADGKHWEVIRLGRTVLRWDLKGNEVNVRD